MSPEVLEVIKLLLAGLTGAGAWGFLTYGLRRWSDDQDRKRGFGQAQVQYWQEEIAQIREDQRRDIEQLELELNEIRRAHHRELAQRITFEAQYQALQDRYDDVLASNQELRLRVRCLEQANSHSNPSDDELSD